MLQIWGYFINVKDTHVCCIKFDIVRIFERCLYETREVFVPFVHVL